MGAVLIGSRGDRHANCKIVVKQRGPSPLITSCRDRREQPGEREHRAKIPVAIFDPGCVSLCALPPCAIDAIFET